MNDCFIDVLIIIKGGDGGNGGDKGGGAGGGGGRRIVSQEWIFSLFLIWSTNYYLKINFEGWKKYKYNKFLNSIIN